jgi:tyrosyl-DNA phosphodiesterase 1
MIIGTLKPVPSDNGLYFDGDTDDDSDSDIEILEEIQPTGWAYVGSHNFTMSAWGSFMEKSTQFSPIFSVRFFA